MALTKVSRGLLSTSIVDNGNATAITIDSSENVGIGTTAPERMLHVDSAGVQIAALISSTSTIATRLALMDANTTSSAKVGIGATADNLGLYAGGAARATLDSSGNFGIGTSSPDANLHVFKGESGGATPNSQSSLVLENNSNTYLQFLTPATNESGMLFGDNDNDRGGLTYNHSSDFMAFRVAAAERARIDQSGVLSVANTTTAYGLRTTSSLTGMSYTPTDYLTVASSGVYGLAVNRLSSDGNLIHFGKNGTTVGSIGTVSGRLFIGNDDTFLTFQGAADRVYPATSSGGVRDAAIDLGFDGGRFKDLYLSGEIFNTAAYNQTTGLSANMYVNSSGRFFRSTSSQRYKNTIQDATHGLTELLTLRPVTYKGNDDGDLVFGGLIAEEVHDAGLTEFVQYNEEDQPDALAYGNMVSLCIKAIQEQQETITALTARIEQLENN